MSKKKQRIAWTYDHHLNNRSSTRITKHGVFIGKVKHTKRHWNKLFAEQMAIVQFDGNKGTSKVPYDELKFE